MATASFRLTVDEEREIGIRRALTVAVRSARGWPGCVDGRLERDVADRRALRFHSRWDGESDLRAFLASDVMTRVLQLLELSVEAPEVLICWGDPEVGLRSLREIRGAIATDSAPADTEPSACGCEGREDTSNLFSFRE